MSTNRDNVSAFGPLDGRGTDEPTNRSFHADAAHTLAAQTGVTAVQTIETTTDGAHAHPATAAHGAAAGRPAPLLHPHALSREHTEGGATHRSHSQHTQGRVGSVHAGSSGGDDDDHSDKEGGGAAGEDGAAAPRRMTRRERDDAELKELFKGYAFRISFFLWCQGLFNNFHYNLVISGANKLATTFNMTQYVALISFMNVFFGIIARILNAFVAHRISYNIRMTLMTCGTLIGLLVVSFAGDIGGSNDAACFVVLLIGVAFVGTSYSYGETVALSFIQRYPPNIVGAWGSGTGISGVITAVLFIVLISAAHLTPKYIFLITLPLSVCYWFVFCFGLVAPHKVVTITYVDGSKPPEVVVLHRGFENRKMAELEALKPEIEISDYSYKMIMNFRGLSWQTIPAPATRYGKIPGGNVVNDEDAMYAPQADAMDEVLQQNRDDYKPDDLYYPCCRVLCGCCSRTRGPRRWWGRNGYVIGLLHNRMFWFYFNLSVVYITEYAAQFMAPFSFYCKVSWEGSFWISNAYTITQFCYQLGVFLSRSSLMCIKIPYVGVMSIIQTINAVGWLVQAKTKFISIHSSESAETGLSFLLFIWMLCVGLVGGASYVNVFYLILCRGQKMQQQEEDEAIGRYLEGRPTLSAGASSDGLTVPASPTNPVKPQLTAGAVAGAQPREGVVEDHPSNTSATGGTATQPEVGVTATQPSKLSKKSASALSTLKKRTMLSGSKTGDETGKKASSISSPMKKKEVEGQILHTDTESEDEEAPRSAESVDMPDLADVDPTLVRLGMPHRKLTDAEADEIELIRSNSADEWQRRRELSMAMGSLYAMVGICIGTILDVIFTVTILTSKSTCEEG